MRYLWKKRKPLQGRLRHADGELFSSEQRTEAMARYSEKLQWGVRASSAVPDRPNLGPELPVTLGDILAVEVEPAVEAGRQQGVWGRRSAC